MGLISTLIQATILSVLSSVIAQLISAHQANKDIFDVKTLQTLDPAPIVHFIIYTLVNVPVNVAWQNLLEAVFPGSKPAPAAAHPKKTDEKQTLSNQKQAESQPQWTNTVIKFLLDQSVGAAFNIPLFLGTIGLCRGQNVSQILRAIETESWDIYVAGLKLWPAVSATSFAVIPVDKRVIFGSIAGVAWNIYLSLKARA